MEARGYRAAQAERGGCEGGEEAGAEHVLAAGVLANLVAGAADGRPSPAGNFFEGFFDDPGFAPKLSSTSGASPQAMPAGHARPRAFASSPSGSLVRARGLRDELDESAAQLARSQAELGHARDRIALLAASEATLANGRLVAAEKLAASRRNERMAALRRAHRVALALALGRALCKWMLFSAQNLAAADVSRLAHASRELERSLGLIAESMSVAERARAAAIEASYLWGDERAELLRAFARAGVRIRGPADGAPAASDGGSSADGRRAGVVPTLRLLSSEMEADHTADGDALRLDTAVVSPWELFVARELGRPEPAAMRASQPSREQARLAAADARHAAAEAARRAAQAEEALDAARMALAHEKAAREATRAECASWRQRALELETSLDEAMAAAAEAEEAAGAGGGRGGWLAGSSIEVPVGRRVEEGDGERTVLLAALVALEAAARDAREGTLRVLLDALAARRQQPAGSAARAEAAASEAAGRGAQERASAERALQPRDRQAEELAEAAERQAAAISAALVEGGARETALRAELAHAERAADAERAAAERAAAVAASRADECRQLRAALEAATEATGAAERRAEEMSRRAADASAQAEAEAARAHAQTDAAVRATLAARGAERARLRAARAEGKAAFATSAEGERLVAQLAEATDALAAERVARVQLSQEVQSLRARRASVAVTAAQRGAAVGRARVARLRAALGGGERMRLARALALWHAGARLASTRLAAALGDAAALAAELAAARAALTSRRIGEGDARDENSALRSEVDTLRECAAADASAFAHALARSHAEREELRGAALAAEDAANMAAAAVEAERRRADALAHQLLIARGAVDDAHARLESQRLDARAPLRDMQVALEAARFGHDKRA